VRVGERAVALRKPVHQYHAGAAGASNHGALQDPRDVAVRSASVFAEHDLAPDVHAVQGPVAAELGVRPPAGAGVDQRVEGGGGRDVRLVRRLAVEGDAVPQANRGADGAVHGARGDGEHPWRLVGDGAGVGATVAGCQGDEDSLLDGTERAHGDGVAEERLGHSADGHGDDVAAVAHGGVDAGEYVGA